jgi:CDP-Glycerol:Poly(glycerophosphate) glycerophosphotransferase
MVLITKKYIVAKWWDLLKFLHIYRYYVIINTFIRIPFYYYKQRISHSGIPCIVIDHNFIQDIHALKRASHDVGINLIQIPYEPFYLIAALFFPESVRDGSYEAENMHNPQIQYRQLIRNIFKLWDVEKWCKIFLTPSDSFFWIREIIHILKEKGIPCIVIDKEGTISPHSMENHSRQIIERYPFISDLIIVWSERQKSFWMRTGVVKDKIIVAGQPRSDFFFDRGAWLPKRKLPCGDKPMVLFFTFETDAYAPVPGDHIWYDLRHDLHTALIALAGDHPEICFVVKTHPQQIDRFAVEKEFADAGVSNISVLHGPEIARHLIVCADVVIGFQTTALIEAMLAGKRIIYTEWSKEVYVNRHNLIPFHEAAGIDTVHSRQDFIDLLETILQQKSFEVSSEELTARKAFVDIFIPNADGNVSRRIIGHICQIINK